MNAQDTGCELTLEELKQRLEEWQQDIFAIEVRTRHKWDLTTAALFREIYFWSFQTKDPEQWFWKTYKEWWERHGLSESNVETAVRKLLKAGVIEKKRGFGNRMNFRLIPAMVIETLYPERKQPSTDSSEAANPPNRTEGLTVPISEITTRKPKRVCRTHRKIILQRLAPAILP